MNVNLKATQRGMVLPTTLIIALLVGIVVAGLLVVSQQQNYLTARSQTWSAEIPVAEAGIEEAMSHINSRPTNWASHGWSLSGSNYVKTRVLGDNSGYYYTAISVARPPVIVSIGYGRIPLQTNFTSRRVMALTRLTPPAWGIVAKESISMNGSVAVDSFDSSDPQYSTGGVYDPAKARDRAGVATISTNNPAIDTGGAEIYGSVATGPGGTAVGTVGDGTWVNTQTGIQPGHFSDDFNMAIDNVTIPPGITAQLPPSPGVVGSTSYDYVLRGGDYAMLLGCNMSGGEMIVTNNSRLYIKGELKLSGSAKITLMPGVKLEIYLDGNASLAGGGIVNGSQVAAMCSLYGLPNCTELKYSGDAQLNARIYAPQANITITGTVDFCGSIVANSIRFSGTPNIHYDEALGGSVGPDYQIVSWEEL